MRIVSLCPSNTELLGYLDATDQLIGIDDYSDWPQTINHLPRLGPDLSINMEKVCDLQPDLVLASLSVPGMEKNIEALKSSGIPYIILNPQSLKDIGDDILTLGELIEKKEHAQKIYNTYRTTIETYQSLSQKVEYRPSLYWEWWPKPVFTPGGTNWLTEISNLAGCENIFSNEMQASVKTGWNDVIKRDPDHICLAWVGVDHHKVKKGFVLKRKQAHHLNAVKNNNIHVLEEAYFCRPSPRLLIGLRKIAHLIHPNIYPLSTHEDCLLKKEVET